MKESIKKKVGMVEHLEREVGQIAGEKVKEMWMREAKEDSRMEVDMLRKIMKKMEERCLVK